MCLTVNENFAAPTEDFTCYKVLRVSGYKYYYSPYVGHQYVIGETVVASGPLGQDYYYESGVLHAYTDYAAAYDMYKKCKRGRLGHPYAIVKCIGKPEHYVAHGMENDICFTQLFVKEVVECD